MRGFGIYLVRALNDHAVFEGFEENKANYRLGAHYEYEVDGSEGFVRFEFISGKK